MILHILRRAEWDDARLQGEYRPPSLDAEGFIHCSTVGQVVATANIFFAGATDLLLLQIDEGKLIAELKYEVPATPDDERPRTAFPHIHGPLNLDAVVAATEFPCEADRSFKLPASIRDLPSD
jgi:uncharacterized protein (DUF952 family)